MQFQDVREQGIKGIRIAASCLIYVQPSSPNLQYIPVTTTHKDTCWSVFQSWGTIRNQFVCLESMRWRIAPPPAQRAFRRTLAQQATSSPIRWLNHAIRSSSYFISSDDSASSYCLRLAPTSIHILIVIQHKRSNTAFIR